MARAMTPAHAPVLQRCACGGPSRAGGECAECGRKRRMLQRSAAPGERAGDTAPPIVHRALAGGGQPLDPRVRGSMEARFGHSFASVRVHTDPCADASARAVHAHAYTVGRDIVFRTGRYAPGTGEGRRLLAHELAHVVQQSGASARKGQPLEVAPADGASEREAEHAARSAMNGTPAGVRPGRAPGAAIQRQAAGREEEKKPSDEGPASPAGALHLDPDIEAQAFALRARSLLDPAYLRASLLRLDLESLVRVTPPPWATPMPVQERKPAVPAGKGPDEPRPAGAGDLLKAVVKVPAVDEALTRLQQDAGQQARTAWRGLSGSEKALVITQSALIGGGTVAGILSQPDARQFTLDLLQNRLLPTGVPGLQFQFNLTGEDQRIQFQLNVGALLPKSLGFK